MFVYISWILFQMLRLVYVCFSSIHVKGGVRRVPHYDVTKWKHFPRHWPFVWAIHRLPVNSPHKGQWRGAVMLSLIWAWINGWVKNRNDGDLRRHRDHYDVIAMRYLNVFTVEASIVMVIMFSLVNEQWIIPIMCLYVVHNRCCAHAWCHIFVNGIRR